MSLEEYIREELDIDILKMQDVTYSKNLNKVVVNFYYDDRKKETFIQNKEKINHLVKKYINDENLEIEVDYKSSFLDIDYLKILLRKFLSSGKNYNITQYIKSETIKVEQVNNGDTFEITIEINSIQGLSKLYESIMDDFVEKMKTKYFYNFKFNYVYLVDKFEVMEDEEEELIDPDSQKEIYNYIRNKEVIYGQVIPENNSLRLENAIEPMNYVVLSGECRWFSKKEYKREKKIKDDNGNEYTEFIDCYRYTFTITDGINSIYCTLFPKKTDLEKVYEIENGTKICVDGVLDSYNDSPLSLKVKNINSCEIIDSTQIKKEPKQIPKKYRTIFPEPFSADEQSNMFDIINGEHINEKILNKKYVVFDLETTGLNDSKDSIIEIAGIKIVGGKMVESFTTFVHPLEPISEEITKLTNITNEMVADAPKGYMVIGDFLKFCEDCIMVAYNAPFDIGFISKLAKKCNYEIKNEVDDALVLAREKVQGLKNYKLATVVSALGISLEGAHRAINDTLATAKAYLKLLNM